MYRCESCGKEWSEVDAVDNDLRCLARCRGWLVRGPSLGLLAMRLPHVLAVPLVEYSDEVGEAPRLHRLIDAAEILARFVVVVLLSDLVRQGGDRLPGEAKGVPALERVLGQCLASPTLGGWREILAATLACFRDRPCFNPAVPALGEGVLSWLGVGRDAPDDGLIACRNLVVHAGRLDRATARRLLEAHVPRLGALFERAVLFEATPLVGCDESGVPQRLMGPGPLAPAAVDAALAPLVRPGRLYLISEDAGSLLDLSPLHRYAPVSVAPSPGASAVDPEPTVQVYFRAERDLAWLEYITFSPALPQAQDVGDALRRFREVYRLEEWQRDAALRSEGKRYNFSDVRRRLLDGFLDRPGCMEHISAAIIRRAEGGVVWLTGPAGSGKSSLVARFLELRPLGVHDRDRWVTLAHFFRAQDERCSRGEFLKNAVAALLPEGDLSEATATDAKGREAQFARVLGRVAALGAARADRRRVLIVVDGLDEILRFDPTFTQLIVENQHPGVVWLCVGQPVEALHIVFAGLADCTSVFADGVPSLTLDEAYAFLVQACPRARYDLMSRDADDGVNGFLEALVRRRDGLRPAYLSFVVREMNAGRRSFRGGDATLPDGLGAWYDAELERLGVGDLRIVITPLLLRLALARGPLSDGALHGLLGNIDELQGPRGRDLVGRALRVARPLLRPVRVGVVVAWVIDQDSLSQHLLDERTRSVDEARRVARAVFEDAVARWRTFEAEEVREYLRRWGPHHLVAGARGARSTTCLVQLLGALSDDELTAGHEAEHASVALDGVAAALAVGRMDLAQALLEHHVRLGDPAPPLSRFFAAVDVGASAAELADLANLCEGAGLRASLPIWAAILREDQAVPLLDVASRQHATTLGGWPPHPLAKAVICAAIDRLPPPSARDLADRAARACGFLHPAYGAALYARTREAVDARAALDAIEDRRHPEGVAVAANRDVLAAAAAGDEAVQRLFLQRMCARGDAMGAVLALRRWASAGEWSAEWPLAEFVRLLSASGDANVGQGLGCVAASRARGAADVVVLSTDLRALLALHGLGSAGAVAWLNATLPLDLAETSTSNVGVLVRFLVSAVAPRCDETERAPALLAFVRRLCVAWRWTGAAREAESPGACGKWLEILAEVVRALEAGPEWEAANRAVARIGETADRLRAELPGPEIDEAATCGVGLRDNADVLLRRAFGFRLPDIDSPAECASVERWLAAALGEEGLSLDPDDLAAFETLGPGGVRVRVRLERIVEVCLSGSDDLDDPDLLHLALHAVAWSTRLLGYRHALSSTPVERAQWRVAFERIDARALQPCPEARRPSAWLLEPGLGGLLASRRAAPTALDLVRAATLPDDRDDRSSVVEELCGFVGPLSSAAVVDHLEAALRAKGGTPPREALAGLGRACKATSAEHALDLLVEARAWPSIASWLRHSRDARIAARLAEDAPLGKAGVVIEGLLSAGFDGLARGVLERSEGAGRARREADLRAALAAGARPVEAAGLLPRVAAAVKSGEVKPDLAAEMGARAFELAPTRGEGLLGSAVHSSDLRLDTLVLEPERASGWMATRDVAVPDDWERRVALAPPRVRQALVTPLCRAALLLGRREFARVAADVAEACGAAEAEAVAWAWVGLAEEAEARAWCRRAVEGGAATVELVGALGDVELAVWAWTRGMAAGASPAAVLTERLGPRRWDDRGGPFGRLGFQDDAALASFLVALAKQAPRPTSRQVPDEAGLELARVVEDIAERARRRDPELAAAWAGLALAWAPAGAGAPGVDRAGRQDWLWLVGLAAGASDDRRRVHEALVTASAVAKEESRRKPLRSALDGLAAGGWACTTIDLDRSLGKAFDADAKLALAEHCGANGRAADARSVIDALVDAKRGSGFLLLRAAEALEHAGDGLDYLERALDGVLDDDVFVAQLADALLSRGDAAAGLFERLAIRLCGEDEATVRLAWVAHVLRRRDLSEDDATWAVERAVEARSRVTAEQSSRFPLDRLEEVHRLISPDWIRYLLSELSHASPGARTRALQSLLERASIEELALEGLELARACEAIGDASLAAELLRRLGDRIGTPALIRLLRARLVGMEAIELAIARGGRHWGSDVAALLGVCAGRHDLPGAATRLFATIRGREARLLARDGFLRERGVGPLWRLIALVRKGPRGGDLTRHAAALAAEAVPQLLGLDGAARRRWARLVVEHAEPAALARALVACAGRGGENGASEAEMA